jgi:hypothetical protein
MIWLLSLLIYELWLRRLTFHRLNRIYMIVMLMAGIALPLLPWKAPVAVTVLRDTGYSFQTRAVVAAPAPVQDRLGFIDKAALPAANGLLLLYLSGVLIAAGFLLRDLVRVWQLYRRAKISREGTWTLAETGGTHGPCSFLRILFVADKEHYTPQQWQMIFDHERQHFRYGHFLDLALLQMLKIVCWFHPLIYIYHYRLRLLHEYEVDSRRNCDVLTYGDFLIRHAAFAGSLALTHSFYYSPLKNRIYMMTKKVSTPGKQFRFLLLVPLMSCSIWCCTGNKAPVAVTVKGRYAMRQQVQLGYPSPATADTIVISNADSTQENTVMVVERRPVKVNNEPIAPEGELSKQPKCTGDFNLGHIIEKSGAGAILQKMPDGEYHMSITDILVNASGGVDYYMLTFPENWQGMTTDASGINYLKPNGLTDADNDAIQQKIATALIGGSIEFAAGKDKAGKSVPAYLSAEDNKNAQLSAVLQIKNHSISYRN